MYASLMSEIVGCELVVLLTSKSSGRAVAPFSRERESTLHRIQQCRNLDGREIRERIRHGVWQNDLVVVPHRPARIDDVRDVSFALGWFRPQQRLPRKRKHPGGVPFVGARRAGRGI